MKFPVSKTIGTRMFLYGIQKVFDFKSYTFERRWNHSECKYICSRSIGNSCSLIDFRKVSLLIWILGGLRQMFPYPVVLLILRNDNYWKVLIPLMPNVRESYVSNSISKHIIKETKPRPRTRSSRNLKINWSGLLSHSSSPDQHFLMRPHTTRASYELETN